MSVKKSSRVTVGISIAAVGLLAAGILIARQPASDSDATASQQMSAKSEPAAKKAPARRAAAPAAKPAAAKSSSTKAAKTTTSAAEPAPLAAGAPVKAEATATKAAAADATITIVGCLERNDDTYRLKDTEGENAPKSRSWKSGFLRKGSAKVDIVDASNRLRLENHVGHRISVTGMLKDKEIHARSLQHLSPSCN